MKKPLSVFAAVLTVCLSFTAAQCADDISVTLDGKALSFDVAPQIIEGRTLVPLRVIFEALGAEVDWDGDTKTVTAVKDNDVLKMTVGSEEMSINSDSLTLDVPPVIIDDRTLVPARAVAEGFGCKVDWDNDSRTVIIETAQAVPIATIAPTAVPTAKPLEIEYDDTNERAENYMKDFKITSLSKTSDGSFEIVYTLRTFLEGRGTVGVKFRCLDNDGRTVDTFEKMFVGTDYTWSMQEASAVISGKTTKIELVLN
jgi:hypothetical protein